MPRRRGRSLPSKRYRSMKAKVDVDRSYTVTNAVDVLKNNPFKTKFDETVDLAIKLNIDSRQADQLIRGAFSLPHGTGKKVRVIAFCEGETAEKAKAAGAIEADGDPLVEKITKQQWLDFDVAVAHPSMMRIVSRLGRLLGPRGLMPSPKSGTVTQDVPSAVKEFVAGKVEFRNDKNGNIQVPVGKLSFEKEQLVDNIQSFIDHITTLRPASVKGRYVSKIVLTSTMGPGLKVSFTV